MAATESRMPNFEDIQAAYRERTFACVEFGFPGVDGGRVAIRPLTGAELDNAHGDAAIYVKGKHIDTLVDNDEVLDRERQRQALARAMRDPADTSIAYMSANDIRDRLSVQTTAALFTIYEECSLRVSEAAPRWPDDALESFADSLSKRPAKALLGGMAHRDMLWLIDSAFAKIRSLLAELRGHSDPTETP